MSRCYICGEGNSDAGHYHAECLQKVFRAQALPDFDCSLEELSAQLKEQALSGISLPGEYPALAFNSKVLRWCDPVCRKLLPGAGEFILDLPCPSFPYLAEARHFCLRFAAALKIETADCALVRLRSKEFALFRRRSDRTTKVRFPRHIEDFCQLAEIPARQKYWYSIDDAAALVKRVSDSPSFSLVRFFERTLFYFISGCGDVHYKNLRMLCRRVVVGSYRNRVSKYDLEPLSDLMPPALNIAGEQTDLALPLNGKNSGIQRADFERLGTISCCLSKTQMRNAFNRILRDAARQYPLVLKRSFLPLEYQECFRNLIDERISTLSEG